MAAPPMLCGGKMAFSYCVKFNFINYVLLIKNYCLLDEVKAAVVDIGSSLCRFGTAGEDLPRHIFRSDIGVSEDAEETDHKIGDVSLRFVQSDVTIESVIGPDGATDWDNYASLMNYGLEECMKIDTTEYPLMVSNSDYTNYLKSSENVSRLGLLLSPKKIVSYLF
jgi:Actin